MWLQQFTERKCMCASTPTNDKLCAWLSVVFSFPSSRIAYLMIVEYQNVCVTVMRTQKLYLDQIVLRNRRQGDTPGAYLWWTPGPYLWWSSGRPVVGRPGCTNGGTPGAYLWWTPGAYLWWTPGGGRPPTLGPPPGPSNSLKTHSRF